MEFGFFVQDHLDHERDDDFVKWVVEAGDEQEGVLTFHIHPEPWNPDTQRSYTIKIEGAE